MCLSICQQLLTLLFSCVHSENLVIEATLKQQLIYELIITSLYIFCVESILTSLLFKCEGRS